MAAFVLIPHGIGKTQTTSTQSNHHYNFAPHTWVEASIQISRLEILS